MPTVSLALLIYGLGVAVGLVLGDDRWYAKVVLALMWPIGPVAFGLTLTVLLAASLIAFPLVGVLALAAGAVWWMLL